MRALPQNGATPTLEEVAKLAGVSRATASRVFTLSPRVSPRAKRAVERAAEKLRYVPNRAARTLVTGRTDSIGLVIPEPTAFLFGDPFFPRLVRGIGEVLSRRLLQLVLLMPQSPADETRLEGYLSAGHVDGVLMVSLHGNDPLPERLLERGMPVVLGGRPSANSPVNFVDVDNIGGARAAVAHLVHDGRRHIATITGPLDMGAGIDRLQGYDDALRQAGLKTRYLISVNLVNGRSAATTAEVLKVAALPFMPWPSASARRGRPGWSIAASVTPIMSSRCTQDR